MKPTTPETAPLCYSRLVGMINEMSVREVLKDIDGANSNPNKKAVIITMCSSGGLLYYAQALFDAIKASTKPVTCVVTGSCMSAAVMVLQAAHKRVSRSQTIFMLHQSSYWREEHTYIEEMNIMSKEWNRLYKQFALQSIGKSLISFEQFEKMAKPRTYLTAKEALDLKLIDEINDGWVDSY